MSRSEKIASYIGFSVKAGKIVYGYEGVIASRKRLYLLLADRLLSDNSLKKVQRYAESKGIKLYQIEGLPEYFGGKTVKCIGLAEEHLASATESELLKLSEVGTDE